MVGFDGRFIGNLGIGDSLQLQAEPGFHSVTFTIAGHPNRRLSVYVPDGTPEVDFYTKISPLNHEISIDQNREGPIIPKPAEPEKKKDPEPGLLELHGVPHPDAPAGGKSFTMGAVSAALGAAALYNAFSFHNLVVAIAALVFGLLTILMGRTQRVALGIAGIFLAAVSVAVATLTQTGLVSLFSKPQPTESIIQAADRVRELSEGQDTVLYDGEELKVTFRRLYEVEFAKGECYLQLTVENRAGENGVLRMENAAANGSGITAVNGLSTMVRAGEIVSSPFVLSYGGSGIRELNEVNTLRFELVLVSSTDSTRELFRTPPLELGFRA